MVLLLSDFFTRNSEGAILCNYFKSMLLGDTMHLFLTNFSPLCIFIFPYQLGMWKQKGYCWCIPVHSPPSASNCNNHGIEICLFLDLDGTEMHRWPRCERGKFSFGRCMNCYWIPLAELYCIHCRITDFEVKPFLRGQRPLQYQLSCEIYMPVLWYDHFWSGHKPLVRPLQSSLTSWNY